jgi:hypothetical protein
MADFEGVKMVPNDVPECTPEEHDAWFRAEIQKALDDPRPGIPDEEVERYMRAKIDATKAREKAPTR